MCGGSASLGHKMLSPAWRRVGLGFVGGDCVTDGVTHFPCKGEVAICLLI